MTCGVGDEGKTFDEVLGNEEKRVERAGGKEQRETYLLVSPQPRDPRPQFGSLVDHTEDEPVLRLLGGVLNRTIVAIIDCVSRRSIAGERNFT